MLLSAQDLFTCLAHIIYIYTLLIYSGDASGHASVGAGLIYMSCTYYIYIYTLLVYSGDASGHASVGAGLIYMSCTYYIYIYCLYIQVMLLVLLLSAQDLFTCLANLPHLYQ